MKYISLITPLLMIVQVVLVIIVAKKEVSATSESEDMLSGDAEEKEYSAEAKKYKHFDMATTVFTLCLMVTAYIYYIWNDSSSMPHFEGRAAITVSLIMLLYLIYVNTNGYRDIKYLLRIYSDRKKTIGIYELAISSEIFGLLVMTINNQFLNMKWAEKGTGFGEIVVIVSEIIVITTFLIMSASIIITIAFFIKERDFAKRWKRLHKTIAKLVFGNIPSRRYIYRKKSWNGGLMNQALFFAIDSLYKIPMFIIVLINKVLSAVCGLLYGVVKISGNICGIAIIDRDNIGQSKSLLNVLWGSIIIALSLTYFSIVLSDSYLPSIEKVYSFITGIIVIPTIIAATNK